MEAGKLVEWLVKPGTLVKRGDIIAVVETQKGAIEIEVFENGVFERPLVDIGATVPVGTPMAIISGPGEAAPTGPAPAPTVAVEAPIVRPAGPPEAAIAPIAAQGPPSPSAEEVRIKASPAALRLAAQSGIEIAGVQPSGPDGEIVLADVEAWLAAVAEAEAPAAMSPQSTPSGMRAAIAAAMARSKREIPHYYLAHTIDLTAAEAFVARHNEGREPEERLLLGALLVKAVARAAKKYPEFNGHFLEGSYNANASVHVGIAINIRGTGLVAPAIHDTDNLDLQALMAAMRDLVARVRAGRFRSSEIADPTITVSSLGERGVETLFGVIYPPQVAIVGFGMPVLRPWVIEGMIGPRRVVSVTLAGDHRVSDGHRGALFLNAIEDLLAKPEALDEHARG